MFESIYQDPDVVRRHREAVLSAERAAFLREFADCGAVPKSLRNKARHLLWLVSQIGRKQFLGPETMIKGRGSGSAELEIPSPFHSNA